MKKTLNLAAVLALTFSVQSLAAQCGNILGHSVQQLKTRESVDLCDEFKGKTLIVVNTASKCGFTPQFEALETLYQNYKDQG
ncbi:glutathione peroxidase, partial [Alishewanella sp. SMS9]|nr:glutathione peroxidase [Alishewanella sp. SMS9]